MGWELVVTVHDLLVDAHWIVIIKGRVAGQHFEYEYAKCPPVNVLVMAL